LKPTSRAAWTIFLALCSVSVLSKSAVAAGAPSFLLTGALVATAAGALAATLLRRGDSWLDGWRCAIVFFALWHFPNVYPALGGDGPEYYALARSLLLDADLDLANDFEGLNYRAVRSETGDPTSRVQIGVGLFWLPFLVLAHLGAVLAGAMGASVAADGFSAVYQSAVTSATFLYGLAALFLIEGALRRYYRPAVAFLTVLGIWLATPLEFYLVANPFMSHGVSVFVTTVFVLAWLRARSSLDPGWWMLMGVAGGFMSVVRAQDSVLLALPLVDLAVSRKSWIPRLALYAAPIALFGLSQIVAWYAHLGTGFARSIVEMNLVSGTEPHIVEVLFSPRHGLFTWTPLYLAAPIGWVLWSRRDLRLAGLLIAGFALAVYVNSLFEDWWGSDSFGQRRLLGMTALFALGVGETVDFLRRHPLFLVGALVAALTIWNRHFAYIYNSELVARKDSPVNLEELTAAQVDVAYRTLLRWDGKIPSGLWVLLYDNLKGIWLDDGPRSRGYRIDLGAESPEVSSWVGEGWFPPERESQTAFRRSRGRRSFLRVPIRSPLDSHVVVRLRPEFTEEPVTIKLRVNGNPSGAAELSPGWKEYVFSVPAGSLQAGFNGFLLSYSTTPRLANPDFHGKNAVVAVDWIELRRIPGVSGETGCTLDCGPSTYAGLAAVERGGPVVRIWRLQPR